MRNFFSIIVIFAVLLAGGGWVYMRQQEERGRLKRADDLAAIRQSFAHKARAAANEEDDETYHRAIKAAIAGYKDELDATIYRSHPEAKDIERYRKDVEARFADGKLDEARRKSALEGYAIVKEAYDALMTGSWTPVLTKKGANDTRLDVYAIRKVVDDEGRSLLEGKFFFWGVEDATQVSWGNLSLRLWTKAVEQVKEGRLMVDKEVEKVLGKSDGEAQPHIIIQKPASYIDDFPSFVSVGYLWLPMMPSEAHAVDIEYTYRTRNLGGGEIDSALRWEKLPVAESWKLAAGQVWDADEVEATEDEIAGKEAVPEAGQAAAEE